ncbi:MAG: hypothetical protein IT338_09530 [Thermomicrobiales bacterium]|nr:hypothetical protein [Thermomicrobiales bacterium]
MPEFTTITRRDDLAPDEAPVVHGPDGPWDDDEVIDTVLRLVADHHRALGAAIGRRSFSPTLAELRQSPLGQDLRVLAVASHSDFDQLRVRETASRVTDLLLRPLAAEGMVVPAWFWSTAIGRMVARAARSSYGEHGLISVKEAADRLEIAPALVTAWAHDGAIVAIPDEGGHLMVPRDTIEKRRQVARDLAGFVLDGGEDVLVREHRLAS